MTNNSFQNLPSQKMYEFLTEKMDKKELTRQQIADALEVYQGNPSTYFHGLRNGTLSVKVEHIIKAQQAFGLNPCDLFHEAKNQIVTDPKDTFTSLEKLIDVVHEQQKLVSQQQQTINTLLSGGNEQRRKNA